MIPRHDAPTPFPVVDYSGHPGYPGAAGPDAACPARPHLLRADAGLASILDAPRPLGRRRVTDRFAAEVAPHLNRMGDEARAGLTDPLGLRCVSLAVAETAGMLLEEACFHDERRVRRSTRPASPEAARVDEALRAEGVAVTRLDADLLASLEAGLAALRSELEGDAERTPDVVLARSALPTGPTWTALGEALGRSGVLGGVEAFTGAPFEPIYWALGLAHERQTWWHSGYADLGLATPSTAYMHTDEDYDLVKVVIYLSDVQADSGPFSCLRGSHRWSRSATQFRWFKSLDVMALRAWPTAEARTTHYRRRFTLPAFRAFLAALPPSLRGTSHFGDDVVDGSPLARRLLTAESQILSAEGNCMTFLGGDLVHRGGCVRRGRRWTVQVGLRRLPRRSLARRARAAVGGVARAVLGEAPVRHLRGLVDGRP